MIKKEKRNNQLLWKYAGLSSQLIGGLLFFLFVGKKADEWLQFKTPVLIWVLPLLFILSVIIKVIIDTGKKDNHPHV